jgi:hypothetical protein
MKPQPWHTSGHTYERVEAPMVSKRLSLSAMAALACISLAACSGDDKGTSGGPGDSGPDATTSEAGGGEAGTPDGGEGGEAAVTEAGEASVAEGGEASTADGGTEAATSEAGEASTTEAAAPDGATEAATPVDGGDAAADAAGD